MNELEQITDILIKNNQTKVLKLLNSVSENKKQNLIKELLKVDFKQVKRLYLKAVAQQS